MPSFFSHNNSQISNFTVQRLTERSRGIKESIKISRKYLLKLIKPSCQEFLNEIHPSDYYSET